MSSISMGKNKKEKRNTMKRVRVYVWMLIGIVCAGAFFRAYHFHDWLPFKGDAFRDATVISNVYRVGGESLPLLGPRAGGTMLHLGPIFYYFQYVSAAIFHSLDPSVLAYPDFFFSLLAMPMFFFFLRRYFSPLWSCAMTAMLAVSFLAIEYGRFAWNPNSTLFFTLVFSYAVLRVYGDRGEKSLKKQSSLWALVAGVTLAIASQLHFSAFLGLPIVLIGFMIWRFQDSQKVLSPAIIAMFFLGAILMYTPVIFSEYFKHGENAQQFFAALSSKSSEQGIFRNATVVAIVFSKYFLRIGLGIVESGRTLITLAGLFGISGFVANVLLLQGEKDEAKRSFLQWTLLLMTVYFLLYIPLADKIDRPRFFLPFMALPYLYFGYIVLSLREKILPLRMVQILAVAGFGVIVFGNVYAVTKWFSELKASERITSITETKNSKGKNFLLTWGHFERVSKVMDESCSGPEPIFFFMAKNIREYDHSVEYALLQKRTDPIIGSKKGYADIGPKGCYYFISLPGETLPGYVRDNPHDTPRYAGGIQADRFYPPMTDEQIVIDKKETVFVPEKRTRNSRVYWGDIINLIQQ